MRKYFTLILLLSSNFILSQTIDEKLSSSEIRTTYFSSINIVNEYSSILNNKTSFYSDLFSLFSDSSSMVVFDILPENRVNYSIELEKYVQKAVRNFRQQKVIIEITDIDINSVDDSIVQASVKYNEQIEATTRDGISYTDNINEITMYISHKRPSYSESNQDYNSRIDSIVLSQSINYAYQIAYVVDNDTTYDLANNKLIVNREPPIKSQTDWIGEGNKYFFIKSKYKSSRNKYSLDNAPFSFGLIPVDDHRDFRSFKNIKNVLLLKIKRPKLSISTFSNQSYLNLIESNIFGLQSNRKDNTLRENGVELGYYMRYKPSPVYHYLSVSVGASKMNLTSNFSLINLGYEYNDVDPAGNSYLRKIKINSLTENHDIEYLNIPLSIKYGINLNEFYNIKSLENYSFLLPDFISIKFSGIYHSLQNSQFTSSSNVSYSGIYSDFFDIEIDENGVYDFGTFQLNNQGEVNYNNYYSGLFVFGLHNKISKEKDRLFLDLEFGINFNFSEPFESNSIYITRDFNQLNSSLNLLNNVSLNRNFFRFGLSYNFGI